MAIRAHGVDMCLLAHSLDGYSIVGHGEGVGTVPIVGVGQLYPLALGVVDGEGAQIVACFGGDCYSDLNPGSACSGTPVTVQFSANAVIAYSGTYR